jgi:hypothetical protein
MVALPSLIVLAILSAAALLCTGLAAVGFLAHATDIVLAAVVDREHVDKVVDLLLVKLQWYLDVLAS